MWALWNPFFPTNFYLFNFFQSSYLNCTGTSSYCNLTKCTALILIYSSRSCFTFFIFMTGFLLCFPQYVYKTLSEELQSRLQRLPFFFSMFYFVQRIRRWKYLNRFSRILQLRDRPVLLWYVSIRAGQNLTICTRVK